MLQLGMARFSLSKQLTFQYKEILSKLNKNETYLNVNTHVVIYLKYGQIERFPLGQSQFIN